MTSLSTFFAAYPVGFVMRNVAWQGWHLVGLSGRVRVELRGSHMWVVPL